MDWGQSYTSTWRVFRVNKDTWADGNAVDNVDEISITRTADGKSIESGSMKISGAFENGYYRVAMTADQGSEVARVDVATFLCSTTGGLIDYGFTDRDIKCRSVLHPADTTAVTTGEFAPAGADGVEYAAALLRTAINAPIETVGSFKLDTNIVFELGETILDAVWSILNAGKYVMQIDGRGVVHMIPRPAQPALIISNSSNGVVLNGISYNDDLSELPNRYIVITDNTIYMAVNDDRNSPISTVNRGFYVDIVDTSPAPVDGESVEAYARRRLKEESVLREERSYSREYAPDVYPYSLVKSTISAMNGDYRVASQSIECANGIVVDEKAYREVQLWQ